MSTITLRIQHPFKQEDLSVSWVSIESPNGSFVIGPDHRPLISAIAGPSSVVYKGTGGEKAIEVGEDGGLVHVIDDTVILFLG